MASVGLAWSQGFSYIALCVCAILIVWAILVVAVEVAWARAGIHDEVARRVGQIGSWRGGDAPDLDAVLGQADGGIVEDVVVRDPAPNRPEAFSVSGSDWQIHLLRRHGPRTKDQDAKTGWWPIIDLFWTERGSYIGKREAGIARSVRPTSADVLRWTVAGVAPRYVEMGLDGSVVGDDLDRSSWHFKVDKGPLNGLKAISGRSRHVTRRNSKPTSEPGGYSDQHQGEEVKPKFKIEPAAFKSPSFVVLSGCLVLLGTLLIFNGLNSEREIVGPLMILSGVALCAFSSFIGLGWLMNSL